MQHKKIACSFMAALAAYASAADSDVKQLTKDTFDEFVKSNDLVLAECKS
jgi:protein disulfide-isomerase A1